MEFLKKLFSKKEQPVTPFIADLRAIQQLILPAFDPKQHEFKVNLFKTYIKFKTRATISVKEMQQMSHLKTAQVTKQTSMYTWWRASYAEYESLRHDPTILFLQDDVEQLIEKLQEQEAIETFDSVIEYEPSLQNILSVLRDAQAGSSKIDEDVLHQSMHLLKRIVYEVEIELHQKHMLGKQALIDQLKFEEKYINRHDE